MEENIICKGTTQKNITARVLLIVGAALLVISIAVSVYIFFFGKEYKYFDLIGYGDWFYWCVIYEDDFAGFFTSEFFNISCYFGYIFLLSITPLVVGIITKIITEGCEITITSSRIIGKLAGGKKVDIQLRQITAINRCGFNGISVTFVGGTNKFYCIRNNEEIIKATSGLLTNMNPAPTAKANPHSISASNEIESLKLFKELFDQGVITEEEFNAKKKQIMGL